jgi:hypothetical protein
VTAPNAPLTPTPITTHQPGLRDTSIGMGQQNCNANRVNNANRLRMRVGEGR